MVTLLWCIVLVINLNTKNEPWRKALRNAELNEEASNECNLLPSATQQIANELWEHPTCLLPIKLRRCSLGPPPNFAEPLILRLRHAAHESIHKQHGLNVAIPCIIHWVISLVYRALAAPATIKYRRLFCLGARLWGISWILTLTNQQFDVV